jgi:type III secretion protein J
MTTTDSTPRSPIVHNRLVRLLLLSALLLLAACQKEVYSGLSESEANQMIAVLSDAGIVATKSNDGGARDTSERNTWIVEVGDTEINAALKVLQANGLPKPNFSSLGELFQKQGLVSTPAEERVRYLYGVSQDLSRALQDVEGVVVARVQVVIPENDPLADKIRPSSAAVYIRYRQGVDLRAMAPMVKDFVAHSIEGLQYDNVSLFLQPTAERVVRVDSLGSALVDIVRLRSPLGWLVFALLLLTCAVIVLWAARRGVFGARWMDLFSAARGASANHDETSPPPGAARDGA